MIDLILDIVSIILIVLGLFFNLVGVIGLLRMPDAFCRIHATTKCDTMGAGLIFIGLIVWQGLTIISLNLIIILIFIWLTNPTAAHYIAKSEFENMKKESAISD